MEQTKQKQAKINATEAMINELIDNEVSIKIAKIKSLIKLDEALSDKDYEITEEDWKTFKKKYPEFADISPGKTKLIGALFRDKHFIIVAFIENSQRYRDCQVILKIALVAKFPQEIMDELIGRGDYWEIREANTILKVQHCEDYKAAKKYLLKNRKDLLKQTDVVSGMYAEIANLKNNYDYEVLKMKIKTAQIVGEL